MCFMPKKPQQTPADTTSAEQSAEGLGLQTDTQGKASASLLGRLALRLPKTAKRTSAQTAPTADTQASATPAAALLPAPFYTRNFEE